MGDTANPGEATGQDPRWLRGNLLGCGLRLQAAGAPRTGELWSFFPRVRGEVVPPPLPALPMGHRVALSVGAVSPQCAELADAPSACVCPAPGSGCVS